MAKGEGIIIQLGHWKASVPMTVLATTCSHPEPTYHVSAPRAPAATSGHQEEWDGHMCAEKAREPSAVSHALGHSLSQQEPGALQPNPALSYQPGQELAKTG